MIDIKPSQSRRYTYVDLSRGVAATAVLLSHYKFFYSPRVGYLPSTNDSSREPFSSLLLPFYEHGAIAVMFFWMLSGFVFAATYGAVGRRVSPRQFFVARFSRLYPLHFATLILVTLLQILSLSLFGQFQIYQYNDAYHFLLQLFMASNWGMEKGYSFNGPIWSVSVEVLIYAVFLGYMRALRLNWVTSLIMIAVFIIPRLLGMGSIANCGTCFFIGVTIYLTLPTMSRWSRPLAIGIAVISFFSFAIILCIQTRLPSGSTQLSTIVALSLLLWGVVTFDVHLPAVSPKLHWLGDITYSTYLLHIPLIISSLIVFRLLRLPPEIADSPIILITFLSATLALGWVTYRRFELPMQRWMRLKLGRSTEGPSK